MREAEKQSLEQIRAFLDASEAVQFEGEKREEIYGWISRLLQVHGYGQQSRANRGLVRRYVEKLTGLSRAQVTRLIGRYVKSGEVKEAQYRRRRFPQRYTRADIELLAEVDEAHQTLSGLAMRIRQVGVNRILWGSDGAFGGGITPERALRAYQQLPLSTQEFHTIDTNLTSYMP